MSMVATISDSRVMVTRCVRRSRRDPEAFFTALMLPIVLMLLFVYVFGGAMSTGGSYADYVVPGLIVLCAGFGAGTHRGRRRHRHEQRHRGPVPVHADQRLVGAGRPHRGQPAAQPDRHRAGDRGRPGRRLAAGRLGGRLGRGGRDDRAVHPGAVLARGRRRAAHPQCRGGQRGHVRVHVHPVREHRVRPGSHDAGVASRVRRAPAVHPDRGDHARAVDGPHLHRGERRRPRPGWPCSTAWPSSPSRQPAPPGCFSTASARVSPGGRPPGPPGIAGSAGTRLRRAPPRQRNRSGGPVRSPGGGFRG